jgi:hypothetical protein
MAFQAMIRGVMGILPMKKTGGTPLLLSGVHRSNRDTRAA